MKKIFICLTILLAATSFCLSQNRERVQGSMRFQGYEREYNLYIPDKLCDARPLVFVLHGHGGKAENYFPELLETADRHGFAVCMPQGLVEPAPKSKTAWNVGYPFQEGWKVDDCAFVLALSKKLVREYDLNPSNVVFSGMSNGGEMCYLMAHRYPQKFCAIISLAGLNMEWIYRSMRPKCAVPFMEVHGTADMTSKWVGDVTDKDGWGKYISVPAAVGRMIDVNCCTHEECDTLPVVRNTVVRHHYMGGTDGKDVMLYEIIGGKHSKGEKDMDLGEEMWNFFRRYLTR